MRKKTKYGAITLAFDDGYLETYKHALRHLSGLGVRSTVSIPADLIGKRFEKRRLIGPAEIKDLRRHGHEIASHTLTHPNLLRLFAKDKKKALSEIADSGKRLEARLKCRVDSFVFPYIKNNHSRALCRKTKGCYRSSRITSAFSSFNRLPVKDPWPITGFAITKKHSLRYLNSLVDRARKNNLWLIEVFHLVSSRNTLSAARPKPYRYFMHINDFKEHVNYILSKDIPVLTQRDAVRSFGGIR